MLQRAFTQFRQASTALNHTTGGRIGSCRGKPPYKRLSTISTVTEAKMVPPIVSKGGSIQTRPTVSMEKETSMKGVSCGSRILQPTRARTGDHLINPQMCLGTQGWNYPTSLHDPGGKSSLTFP
ncbi:hypothetical protein FKM82_001162 [Ascaphus truei]